MLEDGSEVDFRVFSVEICVFIEFDDKFSTLNETVKMAVMRNFCTCLQPKLEVVYIRVEIWGKASSTESDLRRNLTML